jgi:hypothetical protein
LRFLIEGEQKKPLCSRLKKWLLSKGQLGPHLEAEVVWQAKTRMSGQALPPPTRHRQTLSVRMGICFSIPTNNSTGISPILSEMELAQRYFTFN